MVVAEVNQVKVMFFFKLAMMKKSSYLLAMTRKSIDEYRKCFLKVFIKLLCFRNFCARYSFLFSIFFARFVYFCFSFLTVYSFFLFCFPYFAEMLNLDKGLNHKRN